jgi:glycosyltransferase involved in cell wall biosynthesis
LAAGTEAAVRVVRVCLICVEFFGWGKYGGFGRTTRYIGRQLAARGFAVSVVVPRRAGQAPVERIDGLEVHSYPVTAPWRAIGIFRRCDADIYHSQEASFASFLAQLAMPYRRHVITFRDHKVARDWLVELRYPSRSRLRTAAAWLWERNPLVTRAIRRSDLLLCCSPHLPEYLTRLYGLRHPLEVVGTPVHVPAARSRKSAQPTALFVGRWDRRKRPELFFDMARRFPAARFVAVGRSQDPTFEAALRDRYGGVENLELVGFIDQFRDGRLEALYAEAWVLVNTAKREGLPTTFIEALAHGCSLLSHVNPLGLAERFGYHAAADDFDSGLQALLRDGNWLERGEAGRRWVEAHFAEDVVMARHETLYASLLRSPAMAVR